MLFIEFGQLIMDKQMGLVAGLAWGQKLYINKYTNALFGTEYIVRIDSETRLNITDLMHN